MPAGTSGKERGTATKHAMSGPKSMAAHEMEISGHFPSLRKEFCSQDRTMAFFLANQETAPRLNTEKYQECSRKVYHAMEELIREDMRKERIIHQLQIELRNLRRTKGRECDVSWAEATRIAKQEKKEMKKAARALRESVEENEHDGNSVSGSCGSPVELHQYSPVQLPQWPQYHQYISSGSNMQAFHIHTFATPVSVYPCFFY